MPESKKPSELSGLSALALVGQVGLVVAAGIVGGVAAGVYLDRFFNAKGIILVVMVFFGILAGIYGAYRIIIKEIPWSH